MGILSSLYSGVSGLASNGNAMSVIGNNIANSNTIGFKTSRTLFSDLLSSSVSGSGGVSQVGRGVGLSKVDNLFSQGTFENTEQNTDLAIEGDGFFIIKDPITDGNIYTRAGAFRFDAAGYLVNPEGNKVQGYQLGSDGAVTGDLTDIQVDTISLSSPKMSENLTLATNLDADAAYLGGFNVADPGTTSNYATTMNVYDSLGNDHMLTVWFAKDDPVANPLEWEWFATVDGQDLGGAPGPVQVGGGRLEFDAAGQLVATMPDPATTIPGSMGWSNNSDQNQELSFSFNTTQYASPSVLISQGQDGYTTGTVAQLSIDNEGNVLGNYSNGLPKELYRIALAKFSNPAGLVKNGNNMYVASGGSGDAAVGTVGSGLGKIFTNSLEKSNVDLAQEFVSMITTQRGFQASSKIITTTDEMLSDLINLKR